jgi:hypothetical protein
MSHISATLALDRTMPPYVKYSKKFEQISIAYA